MRISDWSSDVCSSDLHILNNDGTGCVGKQSVGSGCTNTVAVIDGLTQAQTCGGSVDGHYDTALTRHTGHLAVVHGLHGEGSSRNGCNGCHERQFFKTLHSVLLVVHNVGCFLLLSDVIERCACYSAPE